MKWLSNIRIATRLIASFLIVALLAGTVGILGVINLRETSANYSSVFLNYGNSQGQLGYVLTSFMKWRMYMRDLVLEKSADNTASVVKKIQDSDAV